MYRSVLETTHHEITIEKSRFIGHVSPVKTVEEANAFIERVHKDHYNATHNVPVYVIGEDYAHQKFSDDGEPSGTAGLPVLEMLKKEAYTNLVLVITRYFGGVKLGKGGLVRAYTRSAKETLARAGVLTFDRYLKVRIEYDYPHHGKIENLLANQDDVLVGEIGFTDKVTDILYLPPESGDFLKTLISLTRGEAVVETLGQGHYARLGDKIIGG